MKRSLFTGALFAMAGFLPTAQVAAQEQIPTASASWTGLYAGVHFGYAAGHSDLFIDTGGPLFNLVVDPSGLIGGVQLGFNQQMDTNLVIGVEADLSHNGVAGMAAIPAVSALMETNMEWSGSARARAGYAFDNTMAYVTGGVAAANYTVDFYSIPTAISATIHNQTHIGWTAGAGVEHAFADQWTARVEYRYSDFGEYTLSGVGGLFPDGNVSLNTHDVRFGLNYRF
ncbi:outer membrane protein [Pelagibacterium sp.]|uniref:outer membrane protein n=1 Tax=Pelagibacterium sp. TaxID=1967288 RepID=UPI003BA99E8C